MSTADDTPSDAQVRAAAEGRPTHPPGAARWRHRRAAERELAATPEAELAELTALYEAKGLSAATARTVAAELTAHGALAAHAEAELHVSPDDLANPVQAAAASALSFVLGALPPLLAI